MNPSRIAELNHQRALVREQLEWLEREIARESMGSAPAQVTPAPAPASTKSAEPVQVSAQVDAYQADPASAANDARRGCFVAIAIISLLIIGGLTAIYLLKYRDRPLLFVSDEAGPPPVETTSTPR
ncbi:MAG TPA: hypothetical protein VL069_08405 [Opitutus sp.]|nr:hypothetical protein [Opitutus sp.]